MCKRHGYTHNHLSLSCYFLTNYMLQDISPQSSINKVLWLWLLLPFYYFCLHHHKQEAIIVCTPLLIISLPHNTLFSSPATGISKLIIHKNDDLWSVTRRFQFNNSSFNLSDARNYIDSGLEADPQLLKPAFFKLPTHKTEVTLLVVVSKI